MTPVADLHAAVLDWYAANGRALAFRRSTDPWAVLVSEVLAQQTQAARAAEAWERFIAAFPTPAAFAAASPAEAIRAWRGLGYNRRAIALRAAAIRIVENHGGVVPDSLEALQALPGIGPYTARAVLAIAFEREVAALDTNIVRVLDRSVGLPSAPRARQAAADGLVPPGRAAAWTHALMDIGATFCRKRAPRCDACPVAKLCAFAAGDREAGERSQNAFGVTGAVGMPRASKRTPPFESTTRWLRGRVLDRLRDAPDPGWVAFDEAMGEHDAPRVGAAIRALSAEGLVELDASAPSRARLPR